MFGSSTTAIDAGRLSHKLPIHTIDTFEPAPWVVDRLGLDLSREAFDNFTSHIKNLHVHQGFAPDIVRDAWAEEIGFYFDDATHGDPGWSDNYAFFAPFFTQDAIICGDDFAGGWPDIVRNVYDISDKLQVKLFVVGRVWAFTRSDDTRISEAIDNVFPKLKGLHFEVCHGANLHQNLAASWSWGLHNKQPLDEVLLHSRSGFEFGVTIERRDGTVSAVSMGREPLRFDGAKTLRFALPAGIGVQFCILNSKGKSTNTKDLRTGSELKLAHGDKITAIRMSHR
ncbi:MAG: hypothetical protein ABJL99_16950 [Aliishimia sp.]